VNLVKVIPMAFVMIAGPQILSAIFLATTENWRRNSLAYICGAALSISAVVTAAFFIGDGASGGDGPSDTVYYVILGLLVLAAIRTFTGRDESEPPKWMGKLQEATPRMAFTLGFLLLGFFPTDILTSAAVGSFLANEGDPIWHAWIFVAVTLLILALPMLGLLAFGERGQAFLPKARDWMNTHSWIVNEIVIGLFIVITINSLA
jgi:threonine/homoserine/homoserine lactone efflux protein